MKAATQPGTVLYFRGRNLYWYPAEGVVGFSPGADSCPVFLSLVTSLCVCFGSG